MFYIYSPKTWKKKNQPDFLSLESFGFKFHFFWNKNGSQHVLTPNVSNTAAWSVALSFKLWRSTYI